MIPGFFFTLLARFLHEGVGNFLPPSLSELALARGAVCLLRPLSPHATCDDGDGDGDDSICLHYPLFPYSTNVLAPQSTHSYFSTTNGSLYEHSGLQPAWV